MDEPYPKNRILRPSKFLLNSCKSGDPQAELKIIEKIMKILIKPFASVKDIFGFYEKEIVVTENISVGDVIKKLASAYNGLERIKRNLLYAINEEYCTIDTVLKENDVLAIFPPVSGG